LKDNKVYSMTFTANTPELDDERPFKIFMRILASFQFITSDKEIQNQSLVACENLIHKFGILFDKDSYTPKEDFLGMTLAIIKNTDIPALNNPSTAYLPTHISVIIRDIGGQDVTLDHIGDELKEQTAKLFEESGGKSFDIKEDKTIKIAGCDGRQLVLSGPAHTPTGEKRRNLMQQFTIRNDIAVLISFSTFEEQWAKEWTLVGKYIDSFYFF